MPVLGGGGAMFSSLLSYINISCSILSPNHTNVGMISFTPLPLTPTNNYPTLTRLMETPVYLVWKFKFYFIAKKIFLENVGLYRQKKLFMCQGGIVILHVQLFKMASLGMSPQPFSQTKSKNDRFLKQEFNHCPWLSPPPRGETFRAQKQLVINDPSPFCDTNPFLFARVPWLREGSCIYTGCCR